MEKSKYKKSPEYITFKFNEEFIDREEINCEEVHKIEREFYSN